MRFRGKVVLITGAGVGIGRAAAVRFGKEGAKVAINSLTPTNGQETLRLLQEARGQGIYIQGDVSITADARRIVEETVKAFGRIDILVNNAGIVLPGRVDNISEEDWDRTIAVNLKGVYLVSKYTIPEMRKIGGGVIVLNASVVAIKGVKDRGAYTASKGGVLALTKAMAADYLSENIRVNCVCPGTTYTPSLERRIQAFADPEKARVDFIARQPMGRLGKDEEIAAAILFAASDEAAFMTGANIAIDGGMTI
ncbi:MAG: glucose 1-dehydrogenase [Deltaproteobacteria bacterium]|jgi:NAD(P)-dependent dehydrogenase (short-subunit alcohol dehydrogenase family)|nr:glucose 1-dehydrogenase [Deltaproteobacteria bacterium]